MLSFESLLKLIFERQGSGLVPPINGIWLAIFMRNDLGYFDLEQRTLQTIDNPFGTKLSPMP